MTSSIESIKKPREATFRYEAYDRQGKLVKGKVKAPNELAAERLIVAKGYNPIEVQVAPSMFSLEEALPTFFKVKPHDVIVFSRQLATLLRSGISLLPALEILQNQVAASRAFRKVLEAIILDIRGGISFSQALSKHPKAFSEIYCRTISIGEQSGELEGVLKRMADYLEKQNMLAKKISRALIYPVIVIGAGVVVIIILLTVVMPNLLNIFITMNVELPLPTRILIGLTEFATGNTLYLIISGAILAAAILWMIKQPTGRRILNLIQLRAPLIGTTTLMSELGRFSRTVSVLISSGMNLQEIMEMAPYSTNNSIFRSALDELRDKLYLGEGLSAPMSRINLFPPLLIQMVAVGEESNTLDFTLGVVADFCESTADEKASTIVSLIGPLATISIALLVGFIAISVLMPMYTLTGAFG